MVRSPIVGTSRWRPSGNVASVLKVPTIRSGTGTANSRSDVAGLPDLSIGEFDIDLAIRRLALATGIPFCTSKSAAARILSPCLIRGNRSPYGQGASSGGFAGWNRNPACERIGNRRRFARIGPTGIEFYFEHFAAGIDRILVRRHDGRKNHVARTELGIEVGSNLTGTRSTRRSPEYGSGTLRACHVALAIEPGKREGISGNVRCRGMGIGRIAVIRIHYRTSKIRGGSVDRLAPVCRIGRSVIVQIHGFRQGKR